ncbi:MAG: hypothetical protein WC955_01765 [Elusimicrobiota bacterium]
MNKIFKLILIGAGIILAVLVVIQVIYYIQNENQAPVMTDTGIETTSFQENAKIFDDTNGLGHVLIKAQELYGKQNEQFIWINKILAVTSDDNLLNIKLVTVKKGKKHLIPTNIQVVTMDINTGSMRVEEQEFKKAKKYFSKEWQIIRTALNAITKTETQWLDCIVFLTPPNIKRSREWYTQIAGLTGKVTATSPNRWEVIIKQKLSVQKQNAGQKVQVVFVDNLTNQVTMSYSMGNAPEIPGEEVK